MHSKREQNRSARLSNRLVLLNMILFMVMCLILVLGKQTFLSERAVKRARERICDWLRCGLWCDHNKPGGTCPESSESETVATWTGALSMTDATHYRTDELGHGSEAYE